MPEEIVTAILTATEKDLIEIINNHDGEFIIKVMPEEDEDGRRYI